MFKALTAIAALGAVTSAYDLPDNLRRIYDNHRNGGCGSALSGTFSGGAVYCGDIPNTVFLKGNNEYDNMDIDCDGANNHAGDCANDPTGQGQTAFQDTVRNYGISDLDANLHSYVVFGNEGASPSFRPQDHGIQPLSVMAVVCNNQVFYGVWGDTNGFTSTGEASLALGKTCFPNDGLNGDNGHGPNDVLYLAFSGSDAVPGRDGAKWTAGSPEEFQESLRSIGERLVSQLPS